MAESRPTPPYPKQQQDQIPGHTAPMDPKPDHGEESYKGNGRLAGKKALITGGDSGIGRAVAIAFAKEGADVCISYLEEDHDARETRRLVEEQGRRCVLAKGDVGEEAVCRRVVRRCVAELGRLDVLVNNAAGQTPQDSLEKITAAQLERTFRTNIFSYFF